MQYYLLLCRLLLLTGEKRKMKEKYFAFPIMTPRSQQSVLALVQRFSELRKNSRVSSHQILTLELTGCKPRFIAVNTAISVLVNMITSAPLCYWWAWSFIISSAVSDLSTFAIFTSSQLSSENLCIKPFSKLGRIFDLVAPQGWPRLFGTI